MRQESCSFVSGAQSFKWGGTIADALTFRLDACIEVLGGRLTDLEFFARRLKTGQTPNRAVAEIIDQR
jgi:hypothetical protein